MPRSASIAIVGYGIAGIAAAIQLRRLGHRITHFERGASTVSSGAGMVLHPPALRRLGELGVLEAAMACGAPIQRIRASSSSGRTIMDLGYKDFRAEIVGLGIQRGTLHRLLASADAEREHVRNGCEIVTVDAVHGIVVDASNLRHGPFDVVVVADGANSLLRDQVKIAAVSNTLAESAALVGLLGDPHHVAGDQLVQYYDSSRRHVSVWPAGSDVPGGRSMCAIAMSVPLSDAKAFRASGQWRHILTRLCPAVGELVTKDVGNDSLHMFAYRDVELRQHARGRAVLIGDTAHSMSPQLGIGALLALEDAANLSGALAKYADCPTALQAYSWSRPQGLRQYHRASRWLTPLFQSDSLLFSALRDNLLPNAMLFPGVKQMAKALIC
jgi:2-polyprenyl-6-methoxyphenol hydroxylase-like FAD-dependent oxidoreductase